MISGNDETQPELQEGEEEPCRVMQPRRPGWKWVLDALLAAAVLVIVAVIEFGTFPNHKGGFYCGDPKISFKLQGDTIANEVLITGVLLIPAIAIWWVESCSLPPDISEKCNSAKDFLIAGLRQALWWYRGFLIGLILVLFVTEIGKVILGETRPHFLYTCRPDKAVNCTPGSYVSDYTCTNKDDPYMDVSDSTRSFPSGHSSSSFYMSIFMMWYIQVRVHPDVSYVLIPWLHCLFFSWCLACSLTRITDHRHHWWDVLAGSILGTIGAVFSVLVFCGGFLKNELRTRRKIDISFCENGRV
ncbi:phospholipid phosphatase 1 [Anabrus simplex]|uniref:phospholipid phosphatase 1 n=1 Tax=Anabrus simplex TaxID=316456 RepID=UPI0035A35C5B